MDKNIYLINLYDIYGSLLTEKQQNYFEEYYFDNLSLKEISENYDVTRNAIFNVLKETEEKLNYYEEKLNIYEKNKKIKEIIKDTSDIELKGKIEEIIEKGW